MFKKMRVRPLLIGWIESFIITVLFIIASVLLNDPLSTQSPFPWIWFAPVLVALHYGLWRSIFSFILLVAYYLYNDPLQIYVIHFQLFILGGFLLTVICIIYNNVMQNKMDENNAISDYLQKRMQNVAYSYSILLLAYRCLEQSYITKPVTLRSSLIELRQLLASSNAESLQTILNRLLNILVLNCSLEVAGFFPVEKNELIPKSMAAIGVIKAPNPNDFLIKECIETATLTYIPSGEVFKGHLSDYLVAAPLIDQDNQIYALLIIEEIPFLSLNEENLETLNLILQYFAEGKILKNVNRILNQYPDCPIDFANEIQRLMNLQKNTKNDSSAVAFKIAKSPHQLDYLFRLQQEKRGIDTIWQISQGDDKVLMILIPLSYRENVEGYRNRISEILLRYFNIELNKDEIKFKSCQLSSFADPMALIEDLTNIK